MGILNANKEISKKMISCNEKFQVKLSLSAAPNIQKKPLDIAFVLDCSGSMSGRPLQKLKEAACNAIDILDVESDGVKNDILGNGNKVAVVRFSTTANIVQPLSNSVSGLKASINALSSTGTTNHADAFVKGMQALSAPSTNEKILILFTDGSSNSGQEGFKEAEEAKRLGIKVYVFGYGSLSPKVLAAMEQWASSPSSAYMAVTPNFNEIQTLFKNMFRDISKDGATNLVVTDTIGDCFSVVSVDETSKGSAEILNDKQVRWSMNSLGKTTSEGAYCIFTVQHTGGCTGTVPVNKDLVYQDVEGNTPAFPSPMMHILCDASTVIEDCPSVYDIAMEGCVDSAEYVADDITLSSLGRIVQLSVTLKQVCPNKRVALGVLLYELDSTGKEYKRGMKTMLIPAQTGPSCKDVSVRCIKFVLPEELDVVGDATSLCNPREFRAKFLANYVDFDYVCCKA